MLWSPQRGMASFANVGGTVANCELCDPNLKGSGSPEAKSDAATSIGGATGTHVPSFVKIERLWGRSGFRVPTDLGGFSRWAKPEPAGMGARTPRTLEASFAGADAGATELCAISRKRLKP